MPKAKKAPTDMIKAVAILVGMFLVSVLVLILTPIVVGLSEKRILASSPVSSENQNKILGLYSDKKLINKITSTNIAAPVFSATGVIAIDFETGQILLEKNIHQKLSPASTTKIMTALIASEHYQPADLLTVNPIDNVGGSNMGLNVGEKLTFRSLLYGMMLNSGNDAAFTIASNYPGGLPAFINAMNSKSSELGLHDSHFDNPAGFDSDTHLSSAFDLAMIAREAIKKPQLQRVVSTKETFVSSWTESTSSGQKHFLKNINELLEDDTILGIKTGFTEKAGENFVGLVDRSGHKVVTVILNSNDRFGETKKLMDWVYSNYKWIQVFE